MVPQAISGNGRISRAYYGVCLLGIAVICVTAPGCRGGNDYGNRVAIAGKVLKNGEPLQGKATIVLDPEDKTSDAGRATIGTMGQVIDGNFSIPVESGPTPGKKYKVMVTTAPGIPPDGTPKDQIKLPEKLQGTIEIPEKGSQELTIDVRK